MDGTRINCHAARKKAVFLDRDIKKVTPKSD